ncbi:hypothetical protein TanjilG_12468 [Lupinus angustifolius]|uniref:Uncharacterized protein n=1 Tax=Lupinus angustifolius TaxID=3871 RepID=A0A4P1QYX4_LUPAN|nr:PREDICTED: protein GLUTAMINE DUMPER 2-like [Lupinus angustifolius]OIV97711.1 hypothetical protein TanjilG_12468 [Lupinus angustifolius]
MRTILTTTTSSLTYTDTSTTQHSTWHSPIPYLFGGLAAMLGLIAFALLILACSYWKLSGRLHTQNEQRDLESVAERESDHSAKNEPIKKVYEDKVLVIMAGNHKPTFLATPACNNLSSIGNGAENDFNIDKEETCERLEKNKGNHVQTISTSSQQQSQPH